MCGGRGGDGDKANRRPAASIPTHERSGQVVPWHGHMLAASRGGIGLPFLCCLGCVS